MKKTYEELETEIANLTETRSRDTALTVLADLTKTIRCKPGWTFHLGGTWPTLVLQIQARGPDSREEGLIAIIHSFPIPAGTTYNRKAWRRWVFECCLRVEAHEMGEWFLDGSERPFAPLHGPGEDPYVVHEFRDVVEAKTNQRGIVEQ